MADCPDWAKPYGAATLAQELESGDTSVCGNESFSQSRNKTMTFLSPLTHTLERSPGKLNQCFFSLRSFGRPFVRSFVAHTNSQSEAWAPLFARSVARKKERKKRDKAMPEGIDR